MKHKKKSDQWWAVYRSIFRAVHHRDSDGFEFSSIASRATDAAFKELGITTYADSSCPKTEKP